MTISQPCDAVREQLPELIRHALTPAECGELERHLDGCAECRADRATLQAVLEALPAVPAGLEARVLAAQRGPVASSRRFSAAHLGMAATVAAAVIGGALLIDSGMVRLSGNGTAASAERVLLPTFLDPLTQRSVLPELTEGELERLLEEMDS